MSPSDIHSQTQSSSPFKPASDLQSNNLESTGQKAQERERFSDIREFSQKNPKGLSYDLYSELRALINKEIANKHIDVILIKYNKL